MTSSATKIRPSGAVSTTEGQRNSGGAAMISAFQPGAALKPTVVASIGAFIAGFGVLIFLAVYALLLFAVKKKIWHRPEAHISADTP